MTIFSCVANKLSEAIFMVGGVQCAHGSNIIVEDHTDDAVCIKFMSNDGTTDVVNADVLAGFLEWRDHKFSRPSDRVLILPHDTVQSLLLYGTQ